MKRALLALVLSAGIGIPAYQAQAAGKNPQNYICHWGDEDNDNTVDAGEFVLIRVSDQGAANHLLHHPEDFTADKDTDCNAVT